MRTVARRIAKLEDRFGTAAGKPQLMLVVTAAGRELALDQDRCIQILRECGYLPTGPVGVVNLGQIRGGLNAEELERFLRIKWKPSSCASAHLSRWGRASATGIGSATLLRWMKEPEFDLAFRAAKRAAFGQAIGRLHHLSSAAVTTLGKVMLCERPRRVYADR